MAKIQKKSKKHQKPISLYPLKVEKALEAFMKIKGKKSKNG
jgi:hypothetical protein